MNARLNAAVPVRCGLGGKLVDLLVRSTWPDVAEQDALRARGAVGLVGKLISAIRGRPTTPKELMGHAQSETRLRSGDPARRTDEKPLTQARSVGALVRPGDEIGELEILGVLHKLVAPAIAACKSLRK